VGCTIGDEGRAAEADIGRRDRSQRCRGGRAAAQQAGTGERDDHPKREHCDRTKVPTDPRGPERRFG